MLSRNMSTRVYVAVALRRAWGNPACREQRRGVVPCLSNKLNCGLEDTTVSELYASWEHGNLCDGLGSSEVGVVGDVQVTRRVVLEEC